MSVKIIKENKKTMVANTLITFLICSVGIFIVEATGTTPLVYLFFGMLSVAAKVKIK
jgi:hypothetical protein